MRKLVRSKKLWWLGGAVLVGLGVATARALRFDVDFDPWDDSFFA